MSHVKIARRQFNEEEDPVDPEIEAAARQPHPHAFQVKHSYQPISVQPIDLLQGKIAIKNKNWFENTGK